MKTKPLIGIAGGIFVLAVLAFVFWPSKKNMAGNDNIAYVSFLANFNDKLTKGETDSALTFFDENLRNVPQVLQVLNTLMGKASSTGGQQVLVKSTLVIESAKFDDLNTPSVSVSIPVTLNSKGFSNNTSTLVLSLRKQGGKLHIVKMDASNYLADCLVYENLIRTKTLSDEDIYSPITLEAFKKSKILRNTYDTVMWFTHYNKQTYFQVGYGKWNTDDEDSYNKIGLVGPDMKEIIPVQYDLIHGFNTTLNGFIEVEKDKKKGLYNLSGKLMVPVEYDRIFPVQTDSTLAILQQGDKFFSFTKSFEIAPAPDVKFTDILAKLPIFNRQEIKAADPDNITEMNSRHYHQSVYIAPSYLVDLNLYKRILQFKNPLRKNVEMYDYSEKYIVSAPQKTTENADNALSALIYTIRDYYQGGRSEFYDEKNAIVTDAVNNKLYNAGLIDNYLYEEFETPKAECKDLDLKMLTDSLVEIKYSAYVGIDASDTDTLFEAPVYQYFKIKDDKMEAIEKGRMFACASLVKMNDSYLQGCYSYASKKGTIQTDYLRTSYLKYIINEIYASHNYKFKDAKMNEFFSYHIYDFDPKYTDVESKLTEIEKYNIAWLKQKLAAKPANNALAAK